MTGLGDLSTAGGETRSEANGVSGDGSVVVGFARNAVSVEAFRWSGGTMTGLGTIQPGDSHSAAYGVSSNGEVVVGFSGPEAFRWEAGAMTGLGFLPNRASSVAYAASADGSVVVGTAEGPGAQAFRWADGVMSSLSGFSEDVLFSQAFAVSPDGAFVVGSMGGAGGSEAFRWSDGEILGLGQIPGSISGGQAHGVSADGAVVVGIFNDADFLNDAFVWTESNGIERLVDVLVANGATGLEGWELRSVRGISPDGRWITGHGQNPDGQSEAFLADLWTVPAPDASWLVGSALAAVACARRRIATRL
jgi:probable HAF family extracellular repeat protein